MSKTPTGISDLTKFDTMIRNAVINNKIKADQAARMVMQEYDAKPLPARNYVLDLVDLKD